VNATEVTGAAVAPDRPALPAGRWWRVVCDANRLIPGRGVAARVAGQQVAVFLLPGGEVLAVDDHDPCSGASVLSRGLIGDHDGTPTVASPVYKQRFDLRTGRCIDDPSVSVRTWAARVNRGRVEVGVP
jgi:nitrite reductase (NADH) small subunit